MKIINTNCLIFIILFYSIAHSQELEDSISNDEYLPFTKNHWTFSLTPHVVQKSEVTRLSGDAYVVSYRAMSAHFGVTHTFNLKRIHGIVIGIRSGSVKNRIGMETDEEIEESHPLHKRNKFTEYAFPTVRYFSFPVYYEYRMVYDDKLYINGFAGVNIRHNMARTIKHRRSFSSEVYDISGEFFRQEYDFKSQDYLNYNLGLGVLYRLKNNNLVRVNINANISTNNDNYGEYQFYDLVEDAHGTNTIRMGYIGLEIGYTFTRTKKK